MSLKLKHNKSDKILKKSFCDNNGNDKYYEIGIDEVGRGPMFGRVYTAAVILPNNDTFDYSLLKDSKKFHSKKKITEVSNYIKKNALMWSIQYTENNEIDTINIRNAVHNTMHKCVFDIIKNNKKNNLELDVDYHLLVDGNDFKPFIMISNIEGDGYIQIKHTCIEGGDNIYSSIAAASILAKVERDEYIEKLCKEYPLLEDRYGLLKNKGYGTKKHMDGIKDYGITQFHRKSFGICKEAKLNLI